MIPRRNARPQGAQVKTRAADPKAGLGLKAGLLAFGITAAFALQARSEGHEDLIVSHGYSFYGDLKYDKDFTQFDFVNPDAPQGGEMSFAALGTFDSMNPYTRKGRAGALASIMYESLMTTAADAYGERYCLVCERLEYPKDKSWVIFYLRKDVTFSDGTPVTAHDVEFSHNLLLTQGLESYRIAVSKRIPKTEVLDDYTIKFYFADGISRRSLIDQVGGVPIWSKAWHDRTGARLDEARFEVSPGTGPYMLESYEANRRVVYRRNPDYWGNAHPTAIGQYNFDALRVEYFGDDTAAFEGLKAGVFTLRIEPDAAKWAAAYDFPAVNDGTIVKAELPDGTPPPASGFVFNTQKELFADRRVREALALAYNFEWTNESLQYGLYKQRTSFSQGTQIEAVGPPEGGELAFLQSLGDLVPPDMLTDRANVPHTSRAERLLDRRNLRKAMGLLDAAGWAVGDDGMRRKDGQALEIEFLMSSTFPPTLGAAIQNYVGNLMAMGVAVELQSVDTAQYSRRQREKDFDMIYTNRYRPFLGTGTGLHQMYGSEDALISIFNPASLRSELVDTIIDASLTASSREEEIVTLRALDRALRREFFMVPVWYNPSTWVAHYNHLRYPEELPPLAIGYLDFWWFDQEAHDALVAAGKLR